MDLDALGENSTRLHKPKDVATMEGMNDRAVSFDPVYGTAHEGMDTRSHFADLGMVVSMSNNSAASKHEESLAHKSKLANDARHAALSAPEPLPEPKLMGHEQRDRASHFASGMQLRKGSSGQAVVRPTLDHVSHFAGGAMAFADGDMTASSPVPQAGTFHRSASGNVRQHLATPGWTAAVTPPAKSMSVQDRLFSPLDLPDFSSPTSPVSPAYRERSRALPAAERERRVYATRAAIATLPAAGTPTSFRELRLAEHAIHREQALRSPPRRDARTAGLTYAAPPAHRPSPIRAPPSPSLHAHGVVRPAWWG